MKTITLKKLTLQDWRGQNKVINSQYRNQREKQEWKIKLLQRLALVAYWLRRTRQNKLQTVR